MDKRLEVIKKPYKFKKCKIFYVIKEGIAGTLPNYITSQQINTIQDIFRQNVNIVKG